MNDIFVDAYMHANTITCVFELTYVKVYVHVYV